MDILNRLPEELLDEILLMAHNIPAISLFGSEYAKRKMVKEVAKRKLSDTYIRKLEGFESIIKDVPNGDQWVEAKFNSYIYFTEKENYCIIMREIIMGDQTLRRIEIRESIYAGYIAVKMKFDL
jgi:hypothetical protein